ncbi:MAG: hypothetical protein C0467_19865 [Planctomycetaceae bacterium]|nr:hypothetical protein [Planctomycetaceae bacterium]
MSIRVSCSTCNTEFTLPEVPTNRRGLCPRCHDEFPVRAWQEVPSSPVSASEVARQNAPLPTTSRPAARKSRMLLLPLLMAIVGLGVALWAMQRPAQVQPPPELERPENEVLPATRLEGVGYLPADANIVFAVQPGAVLAYARRTNQDARDLIVKAGIPARVLDSLANLGLTLGQFDHIAGATSVSSDRFELRLTMALVLRQPIEDEEEFLARLKARNQTGAKGRHDVEFAGLPMTLARVSPTIWVLGVDARKDLEGVGGHGVGGKQFPAELAKMIAQNVPADAAAWVATNDERWAEKPGVKLAIELGLKKPEWLPILAQGRAAMAAISFGEQPRLKLYVKTVDDVSGKRLRTYFAQRAGANNKIQYGGEGESAFFDSPIDPANTFATLQQFLGDTAKK